MTTLADAKDTRKMTALYEGKRHMPAQVAVYIFAIVPAVALVAAIPVLWGWGVGWADLISAAVKTGSRLSAMERSGPPPITVCSPFITALGRMSPSPGVRWSRRRSGFTSISTAR